MYVRQHVTLMSSYFVDVCQGPAESGFVDVAVQVEVSYNSFGHPAFLCCRISCYLFCNAGCYSAVI